MGIFGLFSKKGKNPVQKTDSISFEESINLLNSEKITLQEFVNMNSEMTLFYSTPFGENSNGEMSVWLLNSPKINMKFYPSFLSKELCHKSLSSAGRVNFVIIEGTLQSALSSKDEVPMFQNVGLLIQGEDGELAIPPNIRVQK